MHYQKQIETFKNHVIEASKNPQFIHHTWFIKYHLDIVEQIAMELCDLYPKADREIVMVLVWLHDYGKILDFDNQYEKTLEIWLQVLLDFWFSEDFSKKAVGYVEIMDRKMDIDISKTALEIKIISSADGCSHLVGPFLNLWWYENSEKHFEELMNDNIYKINKDWTRKIVLPEARNAFEKRYHLSLERCWVFPEKYII